MTSISARKARVSRHSKPLPPLSSRSRIFGRKMITKLVRFYPEELAHIEKAAHGFDPPLASSRFISEAAIKEAKRLVGPLRLVN